MCRLDQVTEGKAHLVLLIRFSRRVKRAIGLIDIKLGCVQLELRACIESRRRWAGLLGKASFFHIFSFEFLFFDGFHSLRRLRIFLDLEQRIESFHELTVEVLDLRL